jgi:hypothetical protein
MRYMMATTATHTLGDISRSTPNLCVITGETETDYVGNWAVGLGFYGIRFPRATTRELTTEEKTKFAARTVYIGRVPCYPMYSWVM